MVQRMLQLSDLDPDYKAFNIWQMRNCADCNAPDPCELRRETLKKYESGQGPQVPLHCPSKVGGT